MVMIFRFTLAGIFLYAGFSKVFNPMLFKAVIENYFPIPEVLALVLAILVPWLQIVASFALVFNIFPLYSSGLLFIMSIFFFSLMIFNYGNVLPYGCGCFGFKENELVGNYHVLRDFIILLVAGMVFFTKLKNFKN